MEVAPIYVLYGSETGTAEELSERLYRKLNRLGYRVLTLPMDEFDTQKLIEPLLCVFICSTTGQGEMPLNMRKFWKFLLRKRLPMDLLDDMQYAVFGCGDTSYARYNWASKKLDSRLRQLGAQSFCPRGEGDEQHAQGVEGGFAYWCTHLCSALATVKTPSQPALRDSDIIPPSFSIIRFDSSHELSKEPLHTRGMIPSTLQQNKRITADNHWQDVRKVVLSIPKSVSWKPGDIAVLYSWNDDESVHKFLRCLKWDSFADHSVLITSNIQERKIPWLPNPLTVFNLVKYVISIHSVPNRTFFEYAAQFTDDDLHKERLLEFASLEGLDDYYDYVTRPRRTLIETLQEFHSVHIPFEYALDALPIIRGRQYSIANRCDQSEGKLELLIALVKYQTILKEPRQGICSRWLVNLHQGLPFHIDILPGFLSLPYTSERPLIAVGPGTGVAPLRCLIQERINLNLKNNALFFGCRRESMDYLLREDWESLKNAGDLQVYCAFSRDQEKKVYVQHKIQEQEEIIYHSLREKGGMVCICGSSGSMPNAVRDAIAGIISKYSGESISEGYEFLKKLEKERRFFQETW
ncbi:CIA machinery NADPH-dependent diflavin oxidoreductase Tah18 [Schizosaccharomyces osmophilus]|uniref:NADPH-dependent diflavin oxidoreductase 1 n=1 Tax=Schizosaccharomyces osmophilus TaxID=2545709 RepID=A0AAE9W614_9SCHI|nr:CIA machinery NADPH-dependent diflavin oxidoreductase Tah18 [Schizosaccharomyces osmophilus]WBW70770.1 CIA machinery NADPH-dependent diflavin oxidoreductase Tah18 [Schizosaccharomyces osmophilus]